MKFNMAMQELHGDPYAFVTFHDAVVPFIKVFGKQNGKSLKEMLDYIAEAEKKGLWQDLV